MTAQTWHLDQQLAERYASGQASEVLSASIEQHLIGCAACRNELSPYADPQRSDVVWAEVLDRVQAPQPRLVERLLRKLGMAESTARLLSITPSLHGSWLIGVLMVLVLAQLAAGSSPGGIALYMALAPVLPLISVAAAFGGEMDPAREMVGAAPYSMLRLLMIRTAAVVASTLVPATALAFLTPGSTWLAFGWLLPCLALIGVVLPLSARIPVLPAAGVLSAAWLGLVMTGWVRHHDPFLAASFTVQVTSAGVLMTALVLLLVRHESFAEEIRRPA
jgi:predicted anti-sigma-YlaC factor YlaD